MGNENQGNEPELKSVKRFLLSEIKGEGERMRRCMQFTVLIGLIAHAYAFSNLTINHDSLMEFYGLYQQKVSVGRFIVPIYRQMTGDVIVSLWLNGVLSLLYVGIAVHLISKMFSLNTVWENLVLAGVCVTNITVTCLAATYFHDLSGDMLALLLSVAAAYLWCKSEKVHLALRLIVGSVLLTASIGFYQAFIAVTATLVCIYAIQRLLNQESPQKVMLNVLAAAGGFVLAVILYFIAANIALRFYHTEFAEGGGTTIASIGENLKALLPQSVDAYRGVLEDLFSPTAHTVQAVFLWQARIVCILNGLLFAKMVWVLYVWSRKKRG